MKLAQPDRRLVIDATCPWRIAVELKARGFADATSPFQLGDQKMLVEHRGILDHFGTTLAVIHKKARPAHLTLEQYWRDVIHHHAHRFARQAEGSRFKYNVRSRSLLR